MSDEIWFSYVDLLRCPFCGHDRPFIAVRIREGARRYSASCECGARGKICDTSSEAEANWNNVSLQYSRTCAVDRMNARLKGMGCEVPSGNTETDQWLADLDKNMGERIEAPTSETSDKIVSMSDQIKEIRITLQVFDEFFSTMYKTTGAKYLSVELKEKFEEYYGD